MTAPLAAKLRTPLWSADLIPLFCHFSGAFWIAHIHF